MSITLTPETGSPLTLPPGLVWPDEQRGMRAIRRTAHTMPDGGVHFHERPPEPIQVQLQDQRIGSGSSAWISATDLAALQSLAGASADAVLELHSGDRYSGRVTDISARQRSSIGSDGILCDPDSDTIYILERIAFVGELLPPPDPEPEPGP